MKEASCAQSAARAEFCKVYMQTVIRDLRCSHFQLKCATHGSICWLPRCRPRCCSMGQSRTRLYHTQEIAYVPAVNEWQRLGQWSNEVVAASSPWHAACCGADEGNSSVEEVLVVHHDALKKVNILLRADELSGCDLPSVPECVVAAKRAEIRRRSQLAINSVKSENTDDTDAPFSSPLLAREPGPDSGGRSVSRGSSPSKGQKCRPAKQPNMQDDVPNLEMPSEDVEPNAA